MKETLRADLATVPGLLAGPGPAPLPSAEEIAAAERLPGPDDVAPPPPEDQLDMFG
jgi:hypothetical protein